MEELVELQGLAAASGACQDLMTMLSVCPARMYGDVTRNTPARV